MESLEAHLPARPVPKKQQNSSLSSSLHGPAGKQGGGKLKRKNINSPAAARSRDALNSPATTTASILGKNEVLFQQLASELLPSMALGPTHGSVGAAASPSRPALTGTTTTMRTTVLSPSEKPGHYASPTKTNAAKTSVLLPAAAITLSQSETLNVLEQSLSSSHSPLPPAAVSITSQQQQQQQQPDPLGLLPTSVLFEDRSTVPRRTLDLTAWASQLKDVQVLERVARENSTFRGLLLRGPSPHVDTAMIAQLARVWSSGGVSLAEVDLSRCQGVTDGCIKSLAGAFDGLTALRLSDCPQLTDKCLETLARKCPHLQVLEMDNCVQCTTFAVVAVAKQCKKLAVLSVAGCTELTDRALSTISEHVSLESLDISNCPGLTDISVAAFLSLAKRLRCLRMAGNPQLTDAAIKPMYEAPVIYGSKPCEGCKGLASLSVDGCTGLTTVLHAHLLGATTRLTDLSLRQCPDLLAIQGAQSLGQLTSLTKLNMSGCSSLNDTFISRLVMESPPAALTWLDVSDCGRLTNRGLDLLARTYPCLRYLAIERNQRITDEGVEALVQRCEVLETLLLSGLTLITDRAVTVITVLHKGLRTLGLSGCTRLTDESMFSLGDCCRLASLDISGCQHVTDQGFARLSSSRLTTLQAKHLPLMTDQGLQAIAHKLQSLQTLDLSACSQVTPSGLEVLLTSCTSLTHLNAKDCPSIDLTTWLEAPPHSSCSPQALLRERFLSPVISTDTGFVGLQVTDPYGRTREMERRRVERERQAALKIQPWFRILTAKHAAEKSRKLHKAERMVATRLLQAAFRGYLIRKKIRCARRVWHHFVPIFRLRLLKIWEDRAARHHKYRSCRKALDAILRSSRSSIRHRRKTDNRAKAAHFWRELCLSRYLRLWREGADEEMMERFKTEVATQHFYDKIKPVLFQRWVDKAAARRRRRQMLLSIFLTCLQASADNSSAAKVQQDLADAYHHANVVGPVFWALRHVTLELSPLKGRKEMADRHYKATFFNTVCRRVHKAWEGYLHFRRNKKIKIALAEAHYLTTTLSTSVTKMRFMGRIRRHGKRRRVKKQERSLVKLRLNVDDSRAKKAWVAEAWQAINYFRLVLGGSRGIKKLDEYRVHRIERRKLHQKARAKYKRTLTRKVFGVWKHYQEQLKLFMDRIDVLFDQRLAARIFDTMTANLREMIEERKVAEAAEREAKRLAEEARIRFERETAAAAKIQTRYRVMYCQKKATEWRVFRDWAVIKVQQQARVFIARKRLKRLRRHRQVADVIREEKERELMYMEDIEAAFNRRYEKASAIMNRLIRGLLGRLRFMREKARHARELGIELNVKAREAAVLHMQKLKAERAIMAEAIMRASAKLQRVFRGHRARKRVKALRQQRRKAQLTTSMQAIYRKLLAVRKAAAIRRHTANVAQVRRSRQVSGAILRLLRYPDRYSQRRFVDMLRRMGLDPRDYQLDMGKQWEEMRSDALLAVKEMRLEAAIWKNGKFDAYARGLYREQHAHEYLPIVTIENRDPVRVVLRSNKLFGFTGTVIRIDRDIPGKPLLELRMDHNGKIAYLPYYQDNSKRLSVAKMDAMTRPPMDAAAVLRNADNLIAWAHEEHERRRPEKAALKIQKAYRCHIARKFVARGRYDHWTHLRNKRYAILDYLDSMGGLNSRSAYILEYLNIFTRLEMPQTWPNNMVPPELETRMLIYKYRRSINEEYTHRALLRQRYIEDRREEITSEVLSIFREYSLGAHLRLDVKEVLAAVLRAGRGVSDRGVGPALARCVLGKEARLTANQKKTWVARYQFDHLKDSPHVRINGHVLYHGVWKGHPCRRRGLVPHGEGVAEFFDCWEVAKEERTLRITVVRARELLAPLEGESHMFTTIDCNRKSLRTGHKPTVFPQWNQTFEVDVTHADQKITFNVYDYDGSFQNEFIGCAFIRLSTLPFKEKVTRWLTLTDKKGKTDRNLGELLVELLWYQKVDTDDMLVIKEQEQAATRLQTWWRVFFALKRTATLRKAVEEERELTAKKVIKVQGFARIVVAKARVRQMRKEQRLQKKLQRVRRRIRIMRMVIRAMIEYKYAIRIQCMCRQWKARKVRRQLWEARQKKRFKCIANMQKRVRRLCARHYVQRLREEAMVEGTYVPAAALIPVATWLPGYGTVPGYPSKRSARICRRTVQMMMRVAGTTVCTYFGLADVVAFPLPPQPWRDADKAGGLVEVVIRQHKPIPRMTLKQMVALRNDKSKCAALHQAILSLETGVNMLATASSRAMRIQCRVRIYQAKRRVQEKRRRKQAARKIQRMWRNRRGTNDRAARVIQMNMRAWMARRKLAFKRREVACALSMQCAYRVFAARKEVERRRCVVGVRALACSTRLSDKFPAMATVDGKADTIWISKEGKRYNQWIVYDLQAPVNLSKIIMHTPADTSCPRFVIVRYADEPKGPFTAELMSMNVEMTKRPQHFKTPAVVAATARYWRLQFMDNHGSSAGMSLIQVAFVVRSEEGVSVRSHPDTIILHPAPPLGTKATVKLTCSGSGWPLPSYQWQLDGKDIEGATGQTLEVEVLLEPSTTMRPPFRCFHCRKITHCIPINVTRLVCRNCQTPFDYAEFLEGREEREAMDAEMQALDKVVSETRVKREGIVEELRRCETQLLAFNRESNLMAAQVEQKRALGVKLREVNRDLRNIEKALADQQVALATLIERRMREHDVKDGCKRLNRYSGAGMYRCVVYNSRGGGLFRCEAPSHDVAVYATLPEPHKARVWEAYKPRPLVKRRQWDKYGTVSGFFVDGRVQGDVVIRYKTGHVYEGPYVEETWLDSMGRVVPEGRGQSHWGRWATPDKWVYEGRIVDNHFEWNNKQGDMRMISPQQDVYEGVFLDNEPHGMGEMKYSDGSRYVGEWFRGVRQGFGMFRTYDGSSYEGEWDRGMVSGEGIWRWRDGGSYVGSSLEGKRHGKGVYTTPAGDRYIGDFVANRMEGQGSFTFRDGSKHDGCFKDNLREGHGTYTNTMGVTFEGTFVQDRQHGVFHVRRPVEVEAKDRERGVESWEDEVQLGRWDMGVFVEWLDEAINPKATAQFYTHFESGGDEEFDGVMALLVAKNLPFLPHGVDPDHPRVQRVLERVKAEAGELVGHDTIKKHKAKLRELLPEMSRVSQAHAKAAERLLSSRKVLESKEEALKQADKDHHSRRDEMNALALHIEQYWLNDLGGSRDEVSDLVTRMSLVPEEQWFMVRQFGEPPAIVWKVMHCVLTLFGMPEDWSQARILLGDSRSNKDVDEVALIEDYSLKIVHYMTHQYNVYQFTNDLGLQDRAEVIVKAPRFSSDNLAIHTYGTGLPLLVDFCKALHKYTLKSKGIFAVHEQWQLARDRTLKYEAEVKYAQRQLDEARGDYEVYRQREEEALLQKQRVAAAMAESQRLVSLCEAMVTMYNAPDPVADADYYRRQLKDVEADDRVKIEAVVESLIMGVEARAGRLFRPQEYSITGHIARELPSFRETLAIWDRDKTRYETLTYEERREELVKEMCTLVLAEMNQVMHEDDSECREWTLLDGRKVQAGFLDTLIRQNWADADYSDYVQDCIKQWETVFPDKAAHMAVQARINYMMSEEVKEQARIWSLYHPMEIKEVEETVAAAMEVAHPINTARRALVLKDDYSKGMDPVMMADTWIRLNPDMVRQAYEEIDQEKAELFEKQYPDDTAAKYVAMMRQGRDKFPAEVLEAADKWAALNRADVAEEEANVMQALAASFEKEFPVETAVKAAEIIEGLAGIEATDARREQAISWNLLHPHEARKEARRVKTHIAHMVGDQLKRIKELQYQRKVYGDQLSRMDGSSGNKKEDGGVPGQEQQTVAQLKELLEDVERELTEAQQDRLAYTNDRLKELRNRLRDTETDRLYLHVAKNIRPSERERQLAEQKRDHEERIKHLGSEIERAEKTVVAIEKELESLGVSSTTEGGEGEEEWQSVYDEASGAWYYLNTQTE